MLFVLGIGSVVALQNVVVTVLCDQFPSLKYGRVAAITSVLGFLSGLVYLTPVCTDENSTDCHVIQFILQLLLHLIIFSLFLPGWSMDDSID